MKDPFDVMQSPFRYDSYGQKIFDKNNNLVLDVRGWGVFQYEKDAEKLHDEFGERVARALNNEVANLTKTGD